LEIKLKILMLNISMVVLNLLVIKLKIY